MALDRSAVLPILPLVAAFVASMISEPATGHSFADELTRRLLRPDAGSNDTFRGAHTYPDTVLERVVSKCLAADLDDLVPTELDTAADTGVHPAISPA